MKEIEGIMGDEPGRTREDIGWVNDLANEFIQNDLMVSIMRKTDLDHSQQAGIFDTLIRRVAKETNYPHFLNTDSHIRLFADFIAVEQIFAFYRYLEEPVLTLADIRNVYHASIIVDLFSDAALEGLGLRGAPTRQFDGENTRGVYRFLIDELAGREGVSRTPPREAQWSFLALFVDTLRALSKAQPPAGAPPLAVAAAATTTFTVHSQNNRYQLSYFPQYRYNPQVFGGSQLSTPVSQSIATGHYCFEGRLGGGAAIRDHGVHYAGPGNTSTTTTAF